MDIQKIHQYKSAFDLIAKSVLKESQKLHIDSE